MKPLQILFYALLFTLPLGLCGQKNKITEADREYVIQQNIFTQSLKFYDFSTAKTALFHMMALRPQETYWMDTLATVYFSEGAYLQSLLVSREILDKKPEDEQVLQILAESESALGLEKEAVKTFEKLWSLTGKVYYQYKIATLQFSLKRMMECGNSLNGILGNAASSREKISISYQDGSSQEVVIAAAALNIGGMLAMEMNQVDEAIALFNQSSQLDASFILPRNNLATITKAKNQQ